MRLVILESPFAGDVEANLIYGRTCLRDSLRRGESPIASHLLYTQPGVLDDSVLEERNLGIEAGLAWRRVAEATVVYIDRGISRGMQTGIEAARVWDLPIEFRRVDSVEGNEVITGELAMQQANPLGFDDDGYDPISFYRGLGFAMVITAVVGLVCLIIISCMK